MDRQQDPAGRERFRNTLGPEGWQALAQYKMNPGSPQPDAGYDYLSGQQRSLEKGYGGEEIDFMKLMFEQYLKEIDSNRPKESKRLGLELEPESTSYTK